MKVLIEFDIDIDGLNESAIDDYVDDLTYEIRSAARIDHSYINYDIPKGRPEDVRI